MSTIEYWPRKIIYSGLDQDALSHRVMRSVHNIVAVRTKKTLGQSIMAVRRLQHKTNGHEIVERIMYVCLNVVDYKSFISGPL